MYLYFSRSKQIEEELKKAKAQEEANTIKYQEIQERLVEERKQTKIDDKEYYDVSPLKILTPIFCNIFGLISRKN